MTDPGPGHGRGRAHLPQNGDTMSTDTTPVNIRAERLVKSTFLTMLEGVRKGHGSVADQIADAREFANDPENFTQGSPAHLAEVDLLDAVEAYLAYYIAKRKIEANLNR